MRTYADIPRLSTKNRDRPKYAHDMARFIFDLNGPAPYDYPADQPRNPAEVAELDKQARRRLDMPDRLVAARYALAASNDSLAAGLIGSSRR